MVKHKGIKAMPDAETKRRCISGKAADEVRL